MRLKVEHWHIITATLLVAVLPWLTGGRDMLALMLSFGCVALACVLVWRRPTAVSLRHDPLAWTAGGVAVWSGLTLFWSVNRFQSMMWLIGWVMLIAIFYLAQQIRKSPLAVEWWTRGYVAIATGFSLYGVWLYLTGEYERLTSTFYWANPFAAFIIPAVLLALWRFGNSRRWSWGLSAVVLLTTFSLTLSRGAFLVLALVSLVCAGTVRRKMAFWINIVFVLILAFGLTRGMNWARNHYFNLNTKSVGVTSRFAEAARGESTSLTDRKNYLESAVRMWWGKPLAGTGAGTFSTMEPLYQKRVISATTNAHNAYLQILPEQGAVGFLLVAAVVGLLLWGIWRGRLDRAKLPLVMGLVALLLHAGIDIDVRYPAYLALLAAMAGLVYAPRRELEAKPQPWVPIMLALVALPLAGAYRSAAAVRQAQAYQDNHEYDVAASWYRQAHETANFDPDTLTGEGIEHYTQGKIGVSPKVELGLAESRARTAMSLDPYDSQHAFLLGRVLRQMGNVRGAEEAYRQALNLDGFNHPEYYVDLADLYSINKSSDLARIYLEKVISLYPAAVIGNRNAASDIPRTVANAYVLRAELELQDGKLEATKADIATALMLDNTNPTARTLHDQITKQ